MLGSTCAKLRKRARFGRKGRDTVPFQSNLRIKSNVDGWDQQVQTNSSWGIIVIVRVVQHLIVTP